MAATKKVRPSIAEVDATIRMSDGTMCEIHTDSIMSEKDNVLNILTQEYSLYKKLDLTFCAKKIDLKVMKPDVDDEVEETPKENK